MRKEKKKKNGVIIEWLGPVTRIRLFVFSNNRILDFYPTRRVTVVYILERVLLKCQGFIYCICVVRYLNRLYFLVNMEDRRSNVITPPRVNNGKLRSWPKSNSTFCV